MRYRTRSRASLEAELEVETPPSNLVADAASLCNAIRRERAWAKHYDQNGETAKYNLTMNTIENWSRRLDELAAEILAK